MSISTATAASGTIQVAVAPRPRFRALVRGELRKIKGLRTIWVTVGVMTAGVLFLQIVLAATPHAAQVLRNTPLDAYANTLTGDIAIVRILSGILALILAAHVIGLEYQQGTIRILLGRGVGRLQLLGAKAVALAIVVACFMAVELFIELAFAWGISVTAGAASRPWRALTGEFWTDFRLFLLYLVINAVATSLLGIAASVTGRSLAFGLTVGLSWFAVDNLLMQALALLERLTGSAFWADLSGVMLGPLLNRLPDYLLLPYHVVVQTPHGWALEPHMMSGFGQLPLIWVGAPHALLVIGLWSAFFLAVAVTLTVRRDVLD